MLVGDHGPRMGSTSELVERLAAALAQQDLDLEAEQALLEALLRSAAVRENGAGPAEPSAGDEMELDEQGWTLLISYAFERRYGWSESADGDDDRAMDTLDSRSKKKINEALEQVAFVYSCRTAVCWRFVLW